MARNRKGSVSVQNFRGVLRLVWRYMGKQHYLYWALHTGSMLIRHGWQWLSA